jgi:hypothetical protein
MTLEPQELEKPEDAVFVKFPGWGTIAAPNGKDSS